MHNYSLSSSSLLSSLSLSFSSFSFSVREDAAPAFLILSFVVVNNAYLWNCASYNKYIISEERVKRRGRRWGGAVVFLLDLKALCCCERGILYACVRDKTIVGNLRRRERAGRRASERESSLRVENYYERPAYDDVMRGHRASRCHTQVFFVWSNRCANHCCSSNWYLSWLRYSGLPRLQYAREGVLFTVTNVPNNYNLHFRGKIC